MSDRETAGRSYSTVRGYPPDYTGELATAISLAYNGQPAARLGFYANALNGTITNSAFYINTDPNATSVKLSRDCSNKECVVRGMTRFAKQLDDENEADWKRINALPLLAHFVGDIHQPLHVAHPDGRGGNRTQPTFYGIQMKLHSVWDTGLIEHHLDEKYREWEEDEWEPDPELDGYHAGTWQVYADELRAAITPQQRASWSADLNPTAWATESLKLSREHAYSISDSTALGDSEYETVIPIIEERLKRAGIRLASLLNIIFSGNQELPY